VEEEVGGLAENIDGGETETDWMGEGIRIEGGKSQDQLESIN
jgi:hypothetical protein